MGAQIELDALELSLETIFFCYFVPFIKPAIQKLDSLEDPTCVSSDTRKAGRDSLDLL